MQYLLRRWPQARPLLAGHLAPIVLLHGHFIHGPLGGGTVTVSVCWRDKDTSQHRLLLHLAWHASVVDSGATHSLRSRLLSGLLVWRAVPA